MLLSEIERINKNRLEFKKKCFLKSKNEKVPVKSREWKELRWPKNGIVGLTILPPLQRYVQVLNPVP